jgi:predicted PurR-regulated permease PerM
MSVSYIISAIILASVIASILFVFIGKIEHKGRKINLNWLILMMLIATISILAMVLIYHAQHDISEDAVQNAYEQGVADGKSSATHTLPTNEEMENWFSSTQEVVVGTNGSDYAVHIIDGQGEEWVLYADVVEK